MTASTSTRSKTKRRRTPKKQPKQAVANEASKAQPKKGVSKKGMSKKGVGGVAPFVRPPSRFARWRRLSGWRRRGFVPLAPGREKRRHRILPRTVIGISAMLLTAGIGAAFAGAAFYAYYDDRLAENEAQVAGFVATFDDQFEDAAGSLDLLREQSVDQIRSELLPLEEYVSDTNGIVALPETVGPSVWAIETTDDSGEPVVGAAFAVVGHEGGTALITSYELVRASTVSPAPQLLLMKGSDVVEASLWAWDIERDLALIVTDVVIPTLPVASAEEARISLGRRVFAISGLGGRGATASPGVLLDDSTDGLQHTARQGPVFAGGPLVTGQGVVVGMTSIVFSPTGLAFGDVATAPDASMFCERILRCAEEADQVIIETSEAGASEGG